MATIYIGLGSNLGDRRALLTEARRRLSEIVYPSRMSRIFETDPVGDEDQPRYLNAVVTGTTDLPPLRLLGELQAIETALGRERPFPNAARTIDLDLLFYDALVLDTPELILPHPRLHERFFVLVPLAELAPDLHHPRLARTTRELLRMLGPAAGIQPRCYSDDGQRLRPLLEPLEIRAFQARAERLAEAGVFPELNPRRNVPYGW